MFVHISGFGRHVTSLHFNAERLSKAADLVLDLVLDLHINLRVSKPCSLHPGTSVDKYARLTSTTNPMTGRLMT